MTEFNEGGRRLAIECAPEAMEVIRAAVVEGYFRLVRGGLGVGGLLLGRRDGETLHVAASRPIPCQHAYGPTFALSNSDLAGLATLLQASASDPDLKGLAPVGWYVSHTRGDLELPERDLEVYNRWFPEAWQVAMVLRPEGMRPTRAAFHVRDAEGLPRQQPEFVVESRAGLGRTIPATPAVPRVESPPAPVPPAPVAAEDVELPLPSFVQSPVRAAGPSRRWWVLFAAAWSVAGVSSALLFRNYWLPKPPAPLQVALQDLGGQLSIQWNKEVPAIQEAESGFLEIQDGDRKRVLEMSGAEVRGTGVLVSRQSGRVSVRLVAKLPRGRIAEGRVLYEGEPVQRAPTEAAGERERLEAEVEQLQTDLSKQKQRNLDLEAALAALRKRLAGGL